ncbi:hypothetical protein FOZ61_005719 [Perkinsus olseni]|uniref:E3 ubiquitin-protein ligase march6 n=1 Tax=Perkinsus olseni TaxID=32597 RepID=A0A7J6LGK7_PEROL|nr:hypothetical protein FOZ61_005719 [Perkinsus olseni]KAF4662345.1 hypothetical protein FOL46_005354 [Perkinsus olseni]
MCIQSVNYAVLRALCPLSWLRAFIRLTFITPDKIEYTLCAGADDTSGSPSNEALWQIVAVDKEMKPPRKGLMSATIGRARSTLNRPLQTVRRKLPGGTTPYISTYLEKGDVLRFGSLRLIIADVVLDFSAQRRTAHSSQMTTLSVSRNQSGDCSNDASSASLRDLSESGHGTSVCRICFDEESPDDPLLRPCDCRGSVKFVHKNCLQRWVEGQMRVRQLHHGGGEYLLVPMKCEICQQLYHDHAYSPELLPRPVCPHVVLEEEPTYHRGTGQMIGRKIHIVPFPKPNYVATVGRSKDCDVLLTDIGVSRSHAAMKFSQNRILLVDRGSKFGTLRKLKDDKVELQTGRTFAVQHSSSMLELSVSKVLKYRLFPERYLPPVLSSEEAEQSRLRACSPDSIDSEIMDDAGIQAQLARLFPETGVRMYRSTLPSHAAIEQAWQPRARQNEQENYSLRLIRGAKFEFIQLPTTRWPEDVAELNAASFVAGTGHRTAMNAIERALVAPAVRRLSYSQLLPARDEVRAPRRALTLPQIIGRLPTTTSNFVLPLQMPGLDSEVSHEAQTARNIADSTLGRYSVRSALLLVCLRLFIISELEMLGRQDDSRK